MQQQQQEEEEEEEQQQYKQEQLTTRLDSPEQKNKKTRRGKHNYNIVSLDYPLPLESIQTQTYTGIAFDKLYSQRSRVVPVNVPRIPG